MPVAPETATAQPTTSAEAVNAYLTAFYAGDFARARELVADDFRFEGPFVRVQGKDAFFAGAEGLRGVVGGHRMVRQWVDGADVSSIYEVALRAGAGRGEVLMSEWHTVSDGRLVSGRVTFDTAAFRALLPGPDPS
jgi:limonene-1,2-epoxide hydrolase